MTDQQAPANDDRPFRAWGAVVPDRPPETVLELHDQRGHSWVRKHPSPGRHTLSLTLDEIEALRRHHEAKGADRGSPYELQQHHGCEAAALDEIARQMRAGAQVEAHSALHEARFILSSAGFDQDGQRWVPYRTASGMVAVPLYSADAMALRGAYGQAAEQALAAGDLVRWARCEARRNLMLGTAAEIDRAAPYPAGQAERGAAG